MPYKSRVASVYLLGFFIDLVNMFMASVAFPDIGQSLQASVGAVAWVANAYTLGLTLVIPASTWLASRYGDKAIFVASLAIFSAAAAGAGFAGSIEALIAWRLLQGLGGGLLIPVGQAMTYRLYSQAERARLSVIVMACALLAPALSPLMGGYVVDSLGWHWVFWLNIPLALVALVLAVLWLRPGETTQGHRPDVAGIGLASLALALLLIGLSRFEHTGQTRVGTALVTGGIAAGLLLLRHVRRREHPVLDFRVLRDPLLRAAMVVYLFVPGVFTGVSLLNMFFLRSVLGLKAVSAGALMIPYALAAAAGMTLAGRLFNRLGPRSLLLPAITVHATGIAMLATVSEPGDTPGMVAAFLLMGAGGGICSSVAQTLALLNVSPAGMGPVSAIWNLNRQLSFCAGVAMASLLLGQRLARQGVADLALASDSTVLTQVFHGCFLVASLCALAPQLVVWRLDDRHHRQPAAPTANP
ncbi:MFS transporter [Cupriavidus basilensis]|uniref:MFS transporter n=1 Tax=Cupriavidus basilensis TaxID=68895 RepID=UPI00157A2F13|nr:MFS transporter [Cupriavidus basilensis]NUA25514.1 multidrug efflux MFS transporter [Cupriavidus basilensis]